MNLERELKSLLDGLQDEFGSETLTPELRKALQQDFLRVGLLFGQYQRDEACELARTWRWPPGLFSPGKLQPGGEVAAWIQGEQLHIPAPRLRKLRKGKKVRTTVRAEAAEPELPTTPDALREAILQHLTDIPFLAGPEIQNPPDPGNQIRWNEGEARNNWTLQGTVTGRRPLHRWAGHLTPVAGFQQEHFVNTEEARPHGEAIPGGPHAAENGHETE